MAFRIHPCAYGLKELESFLGGHKGAQRGGEASFVGEVTRINPPAPLSTSSLTRNEVAPARTVWFKRA